MSFERTGHDGTFHAGPGRDFTTRGKSQPRSPFAADNDMCVNAHPLLLEHYLIATSVIKRAPQSGYKPSPLTQRGGHQPKDMRDALTRARDGMQDRFKPNASLQKQTQALAARKPPTFRDAMGWMVSSIGATLDLVDFLGHASTKAGLRVALPKLMGGIGIVGGLFGIWDNAMQLKEKFNWNDLAQAVIQGVIVGMALFVIAGGSTVLVPIVAIGGMTLFAWELAETHFGW